MESLALAKADYEVEIADFMGWGRDSDQWSDDETARIKRDLGSALRRFYYPVPPHDWSFLRPFISLTLTSGERTTALPDNYGGVEGNVSVADSGGSSFSPVRFGNPNSVQNLYAASTSATGRPQLVSVRSKKHPDTGKQQRSELYVFPEADADYTLTFQMYMNPDFLLNDVMPYALGGAEHSETILEACLAVAEERRMNIPDGMGPHGVAFAKRLLASMALDRRKKPQWIGANRDTSDGVEHTLDRGYNWAPITINGTEYT